MTQGLLIGTLFIGGLGSLDYSGPCPVPPFAHGVEERVRTNNGEQIVLYDSNNNDNSNNNNDNDIDSIIVLISIPYNIIVPR